MNISHKHVPGAGSEPAVEPPRWRDVHCMEITSKKIGWGFWGICSCGWVCCNADRREVEIAARLHTFEVSA